MIKEFPQDFDGMTVNERLWTLGISDDFEEAVESGNLEKVHEILHLIRLASSKQIWPQKSGKVAISIRFAGAKGAAAEIRDKLISDFEDARNKGDFARMRQILLSIGLQEQSLRWPTDARPPSK